MSGYCSPNTCTAFENNIQDILDEIPFIRKGRKGTISNVPSVFDIEATSFYKDDEKQALMYAWVFGINGRCIRGRTWGEFLTTMKMVEWYYGTNENKRFIIYVHNLAYEFQFMHKYFEWDKVFSMDKRKPLYAITKGGIEFRCSYLLSGYSLEILGNNLTKYKVNKKVGDLDYSLLRHPRTVLSETEWGYILNDGLVVMAHIQEEIERLGSLAKLPLTKTGYVRNLCREKCLKGADKFSYNRLMKSLHLSKEEYLLAKRAYMGGFTHANIKYVDREIKNVDSFDFTSSYPAVMVSETYPMSSPMFTNITDVEDLISHLRAFCCMFTVTFYDLRSTSSYENYISFSRCTNCEHYVLNNGRIVEADTCTISMTEQDFFIISKLYKWNEFEISNFYYMYKGYLPKDFILTILQLYKDKTELKGVDDKIVEYLVSKGMINACYGMCVTDICRDEIIYSNGVWNSQPPNIDEMLDTYNSDRQRFLYYLWGVWVTAYARANLFSGICEFKDDYIYSDTDSLKVINTHKHQKYIEEYNKNITEKINDCLNYYDIPLDMARPKTIKGIEKPLGVWEYENSKDRIKKGLKSYDRFKTLGAKRYMTECDGEISITIAGVSKHCGMEYLRHKYKNNDDIFNAFTENLYFPPHYDKDGVDMNGSGKMCHTYLDDEMSGTIIDYLGNAYDYKELSGVHLENTDYSLGLDELFKNLIFAMRSDEFI